MSFTLNAGAINTVRIKLTGNTATDLVNERGRVTVLAIEAVNRGTGTPLLTIGVTNGTTVWFKRNAQALAAKERIYLDNVFVLNQDEKLQATSGSATGDIDLEVTFQASDATGR